MSEQDKSPGFRSPALQRAYSSLMTIWIAYVLITFFAIRIVGSSLGHRLISLLRLRLLR